MSALKAGDVEGFLARPDLSKPVVLIYGPDQGLVNERAERLARTYLGKTDDPFALVRLEGDVLSSDPARLADEAHTAALFGGRRVVRVRTGSRPVVAAVQPLLSTPPRDALVILEAADLKGNHALRKLVEDAQSGVALPCYADEARDLSRMIDEEMAASGLTIDPEARRALIEGLGGDRMASRQEVRKVALYAHGTGKVTLADVEAISGDVSAPAIDQAIDAMGLGERDRFVGLYRRLVSEGTQPTVIAGQALRHLLQLQLARSEVDRGRTSSDAMRTLAPPVFFKRQGLFERQLVSWTVQRLDRAIEAVSQAVLDSRRMPALGDSLVERTLLSLAVNARR
jgi:DNA polymerase-3 subunit delta